MWGAMDHPHNEGIGLDMEEHLGLVMILGGVAVVFLFIAMAYFTRPKQGRVHRRNG